MELVYLLILLTIAGVSIYVTGRAIDDARGTAGFSLGIFLALAVLSGCPGMLILLYGFDLNISVFIWFFITAAIHIVYCIKLFGGGRGVAVSICSMIASSLMVILIILTIEQLRQSIQAFKKNHRRK